MCQSTMGKLSLVNQLPLDTWPYHERIFFLLAGGTSRSHLENTKQTFASELFTKCLLFFHSLKIEFTSHYQSEHNL